MARLHISPDDDARGVWTLGTTTTIALCALAGVLFGDVLLRFAAWCVVVLLVSAGAL